MLRSIGSVLLGFVTYWVLIIAFDVALLLAATGGKMPDPAMMKGREHSLTLFFSVGNLAGGFFFGIAAGYVTAWVARRGEVAHALVLMGLALAVGIPYTISRLTAREHVEPTWYLVGIQALALTIPLGGFVRARHVRQRGL